jgi:HlyD family secretion protein
MDKTSPPPPNSRAQVERFLGMKPRSGFARLLVVAAAAGVVAILLVVAWLVVRGSSQAPQYATATIERGNLVVAVSATGNLQPIKEVTVGSELSGIVVEVNVDNNDRVTKGQVLARLDPSRLSDTVRVSEAAKASAEASVAQAEATLKEVSAILAREEEVHKLSGGKAPAATELDTARAVKARAQGNLLVTRAAVRQAEATLSSDRTQLSKTAIVSPVNGVVLSRNVEPGQTVAASLNAPVLFTLAEDLSHMQLEVKVDEADAGQVRAGQRATFLVDAYPGRSFEAVVKRLDLGATSTTSSSGSGQVVAYTAVLTADNADLALRPGMTGTASILATEKQGVLLAPNAALRFTPGAGAAVSQSGAASVLMPRIGRSSGRPASVAIGRGSRQTIYVLGDKGALRAITVQAGDSNGSQTEVAGEGLKAGMKVVTGRLAGAKAPS